ncbi:hypothetical protein E8E13_005884 [Curvularia kusanoi]|uniref:Uncharacterized protein n=1 Tax=Curvularia kusanoi TaxID=90978 RepID=A0A9P4T9U5_CURKU|nr:hypothetical protein E8E13_005884 [Curvularia kusanoi]
MDQATTQVPSKGRSDESLEAPLAIAQRDPTSIGAGNSSTTYSEIGHFALNFLLVIPPVVSLIYAWLVARNNGVRVDQHPVPELQTAARYGPTVFPVAFAAIMGTFLTGIASWRLEHGISMLSLEYLLNSRTVFSAVTTPISLRSVNLLAPLLLALWVLSPLGGQAALRVVELAPGLHSEPCEYQYLDVMSTQRVCSPTSSAGMDLTPSIVSAFNGALASTPQTQFANVDAYGNLKIPMLESCTNNGIKQDSDGWIDTSVTNACAFASINGLPFRGISGENHTFNMETSYTYSDCSISHTLASPGSGYREWIDRMRNETLINNGITLALSMPDVTAKMNNRSEHLVFESITRNARTQANCSLSQTYVETEVFCQNRDCSVKRIRKSTSPHNATHLLPLHGRWGYNASSCADGSSGFLKGLISSTVFMSMYGSTSMSDPYSTPIEYYITHPYSPYSAHSANSTSWRGEDIYPVGHRLFSERFSQLWNTYWLCTIAPEAVTGDFTQRDMVISPFNVVTTTGTMTPYVLQLHTNKGWLTVLVVASSVMLGASIANIAVGRLQTRPDILERVSILAKDSPNTVATYRGRAQESDTEIRLRDVRLSLRDIESKESSYAAVETDEDDART